MMSSSCVIKGWSSGLSDPGLDFIKVLIETMPPPPAAVVTYDYAVETRACISFLPDLYFYELFCKFLEIDTLECIEVFKLLLACPGWLPFDRVPMDDMRFPATF